MPTITTSLTNSEYRAVKAYSKSDLDLISKSPALLEWSKNAPSDGSDSVDLGTHLHCALLEPDVFAAEYIEAPKFDLRTKAGKEQKEAFESACAGKTVLDNDTYQQVINMRDSALAHPVARELLTQPGKSEASIFWELDGLKLKARPDRIIDSEHFGFHALLDVKKTKDIDTFHFSVRDFRYHVQAAFYSDAYEQLTGEVPRFIFIAIGEKRSIGRYPVRVYELPQWLVEKGREAYRKDLDAAKEFEAFGCGLDIEELVISDRFFI